MKISRKLIKDLKETTKEPDGLYVWIPKKDAEEILSVLKISRIRNSHIKWIKIK